MVDAAAAGLCIGDIETAAGGKCPLRCQQWKSHNTTIWCTSALELQVERSTRSFFKADNYLHTDKLSACFSLHLMVKVADKLWINTSELSARHTTR